MGAGIPRCAPGLGKQAARPVICASRLGGHRFRFCLVGEDSPRLRNASEVKEPTLANAPARGGSMTSRIEMTGQVLYDLVWSKPLHKAAATFSMSHLALKRLCERHQIPLPPLGYRPKNPDLQKQDRDESDRLEEKHDVHVHVMRRAWLHRQ